MEEEAASGAWLIIIILLLFSFLFLAKFILERNKNLPPSPPSLPIIGHLHLIKQPLHRSLNSLTQKYGHMVFLKLGTRKALVVSSPEAVEECLTKNNDIIFANRPKTLAGKHLNYNNKTMGFAPYGDHWRGLRRLTTLELFSANRLAMLARVREEEVHLLVKQLFEDCKGHQNLKVELRPRFMELSFNIMLRMISGKRYYGKDIDEEGKEFQILVKEMAELLGSGNLNDFIPLLKWVDFQSMEKRMVSLMKKVDNFLQKLLDDHRRNRSIKGNQENNMNLNLIDVMLDLQHKDPEFYTHETVKGVIVAMLTAGSDTTAITLEWAASLLLNNPKTMKKLEDELHTYGGHDQLLNESEAAKLKYLQNVITETLRLYPAAPLLLPHENSNDCKVCGYDIPKGTMLFVNLWTLQRDPNLWVDPTKFVPERFEGDGGGGGDHGGVVYNVIPFGVGRRACPGGVLAKRVMGHALGALIQCFELDKIGNEEINMKEGVGLTMPKVEPLVALCRPRQQMLKVLSNI
ncbi:hypothetical protein PIB30_029852 [Stylosanthes scabra]|uniref:Cytochrome P450 n=1 Tax=Stylosanthes scabra TaxID=79078 RepID=A0ABU6Y9Q2_9FABA|nr:hypothetical protein [Stylosanthes scabra]